MNRTNLVETNATEQKQEESKKSENDYYFITSKLDRNTMYSANTRNISRNV
ncbi:MAG: hypothetical protein V8R26_00985 [Clostridia bacterium]